MAKKKLPKFDKDETSREFNKRKPNFDSLENEAHFTLKKSLGKTDIKLHSIAKRVKTLDSFLGKIDRYQIENPFEQIEDVVGLRVICLFLSDIERIGDIIRKCFKIVKDDNKIDNSNLASFGYMSVHFIAKLGDGYKGSRYEDITDIPFEIQVRTIAMDAWANISHYLDYKTDQDIPPELKRDFYALSGMFYVADKHFQLFFEQRKEKQEEIANTFERGNKKDIYSQPINLDTLNAYMIDKFPNSLHSPSTNVSSLVDDLKEAGYKTIGEIEKVINNSQDVIGKFFEDMQMNIEESYDTGIVGKIFVIADDNFLRICSRKFVNSSDELEKFIKNEKAIAAKYYHLIKN